MRLARSATSCRMALARPVCRVGVRTTATKTTPGLQRSIRRPMLHTCSVTVFSSLRPRNPTFATMPSFNRATRLYSTQTITVQEATMESLSDAKYSTGLTGLPVQPHGRDILLAIYEKILKELSVLEPDCPYRVVYEQTLRPRMKILQENEDIRKIEQLIGRGQIEELIDAAEKDLEHSIPTMLREKPWEVDKWHKPFALWTNIR